MQSRKHTQLEDSFQLPSRVYRTIGIDVQAQSPTTSRVSSKTPALSVNQARELDWQHNRPSPRPWNETLAFAADG